MDKHVGEESPDFVASSRIEDERRVVRHSCDQAHLLAVDRQFDEVADEDANLQCK